MLNILKKDCPSYADQISADIVDSENEAPAVEPQPEEQDGEDDIGLQIEKQVRKCIKQQSK